MENNNDDFELNFDDDVVDMTDPNRQPASDMYGTYNNTQYNGTQYNNNTQYNDDIYGVYQPGRSYESRAEAEAARRESRFQEKEKSYKVVNVLYHIALCLSVGYIAYFLITKNYDISLFQSLSAFVGLYFEMIFIVDACMMYGRYKKASLLVTGIAFPFLYPFCRSSASSKSKSIAALWFVASIIVIFLFVKDAALPMVLNSRGRDVYASEYEGTMEKFKEYKYDGKTETDSVIKVWFNEYKLNVKKEDTANIYVELSGQTSTEIQGVVKSDLNINPNTVFELKVKKDDGSYEISSLRINNKLYNQYKDELWKYWYSNYEKALPW